MAPDWSMGLLAAVVTLTVAVGFGIAWQRRDGRVRQVSSDASVGRQELLRRLGVEPGVPATLLQFSSAFCAPCRATRRICVEVTELLDGVRHVEVDAEQRLDAVRALDVLRTPTLLVVDAEGRVASRASGQPSKAHVIAAVAPLLEPALPKEGRDATL